MPIQQFQTENLNMHNQPTQTVCVQYYGTICMYSTTVYTVRSVCTVRTASISITTASQQSNTTKGVQEYYKGTTRVQGLN